MTMQLESIFTFGQYKGRSVKDIFVENVGYLCWMRDTKKNDKGDDRFFSSDVLQALDMCIVADKKLAAKFKPWNRATVIPDDTPFDPADEAPPRVTYQDNWGAF